MEAARKRDPRPCRSPALQEVGNVTALFGMLAKAPERFQSFDDVVKERDALHRLFEQAPGFMALLEGPDHRYTFSNAANNRLFGRWDLVGKTVAESFPELIEQGVVERLDQVFATGEPFVGNGISFEIGETASSDARRRIINFVYQPIRCGPDAPVTGIFIEGHDVTEQHEAHAKLQALQMELIHVSRVSAMGSMASTVAHELNQPLAAVVNYLAAASRIADRDGSNPLLEECLGSATDAAFRAGNILRLLRDLTLSGTDLSPCFEVQDAIEQAAQLVRAARPNIAIDFDLLPGATACVDRVQFQQVILNLVRNAQEACGEGSCHLLIKVVRAESFLEVSLADNGPGFAEDDLASVFEALFTTKPQGMGVGLSVCRTIIEEWGGKISAGNAPGAGATVRFTIPAGEVVPKSI